MALRVLLADESATIKKVFTLALQDFNMELFPISHGVDVLQGAIDHKPDIIFADVLLQKKNGYDLSKQLKSHIDTQEIPIVLLWSSFLELDANKFEESLANDHLEKPFDVDSLRNAILKWVPQLHNDNLGEHLDFPEVDTQKWSSEIKDHTAKNPEPLQEPPKSISSSKRKSLDDQLFDQFNQSPDETTQIEENQKTQAPETNSPPSQDKLKPNRNLSEAKRTKASTDDLFGDVELNELSLDNLGSWSESDLSDFDLNNLEEHLSEIDQKLQLNDEASTLAAPELPKTIQQETNSETKNEELFGQPSKTHDSQDNEAVDLLPPVQEQVPSKIDTTKSFQLSDTLSKAEMTEIIKNQSKEVIEAVVWDIVPEIAKQLVQKEIDRLMGQAEL